MYTSAYLHTFIGCDKTPVLAQALKIQKLNKRNDVQSTPFTCDFT